MLRIDRTYHHGDVSIEGAVYTLYASSDIYNVARTIKCFSKDDEIAKFTFNEKGIATVNIINSSTPVKLSINQDILKGLPMGSYYLKETEVPKGYTQDMNTYVYTYEYKDDKTEVISKNEKVKNKVEQAPFEVIKISSNDNTNAQVVEGAEFTAILKRYVEYYGSFDEAKKHFEEFAEDEYSVFKTGSNGHGISGLLAYGDYVVNETYTPSPEIETVKEFYVTINKNSRTPIKEYIPNDFPFSSYIKIIKQDKKTGKKVTLSNATFELYKLNEETNKWEQVNCKVKNQYYKFWVTDAKAIAYTETKLEAGKYKASEIVVPNGFLQLDEDIIFEVNNQNKTLEYDKDFDAWITVVAENNQPSGNLVINKLVKLRDNMDKSLINDIDFTKITFRLTASENIIDYADGAIIYKKGQIVGEYSLNEDGTLRVNDLPMGHYILQEISTINGVALNETIYNVNFNQEDTLTKVYNIKLDIENETTLVEITKADIGGKEILGASLQVLDLEENVIDEWISTEESHKMLDK